MLAFVKYLPWLAKLGSFGSWFAPLAGLIPGGQIGVIIMAVVNFIVKVVTGSSKTLSTCSASPSALPLQS